MRIFRDAFKAQMCADFRARVFLAMVCVVAASSAEAQVSPLPSCANHFMGCPSSRTMVPSLKPRPEVVTGAGDPELDRAWHLDVIGARHAWKFGEGNINSRLAVLDTGVDYNHPELAPRLVRSEGEIPGNGIDDDDNNLVDDVMGWDWVRSHGLPWDSSGQGSAWAALALATRDNGRGSAGVCPGCGLVVERIFSEAGEGNFRSFASAVYDARTRGAQVILTAIATPVRDPQMLEVFNYAAAQDIVVVLAAGTHGLDLDHAPLYPQSFNLANTLVVGASTRNDGLADSTCYGGRTVHLAAPGDYLLTGLDGAMSRWSGTGAAAALVAGAVALVRAEAPFLSAETVVKIILATVRKVPAWNERSRTGGILNVTSAVSCAKSENLWCL